MGIGLALGLRLASGNALTFDSSPQQPSAPVNVSLPAITGTTTVGLVLTAGSGSWTGYPFPTFAYQWRRNSTPVGGATGASYTLQAADYGTSIDCVVTATNSEGSSSATSSAVGPVAGTVPVNTVAPVISGGSGLGDVLSVTNGTWTGVPASFTYGYQWQRNGSVISGATVSSYMIVGDDDAATISCVVTATNATGSVTAVSNGVAVTDFTAPVNTAAPSITGIATQGQTLTGANGTWTSNAGAITYTYQWLRDGAVISGATANTYVLQAGDVGTLISFRVSASNTGGSTQATSATVGPVTAGSATPWTPANIGSTLVTWLDGNDSATITLNGANVSAWTDKSGKGNSFSQATAANQPAWSTEGAIKGVHFDTDSKSMLKGGTPNGSFIGSTGRFTLFAALLPKRTSSNGQISLIGNTAQSTLLPMAQPSSINTNLFRIDGTNDDGPGDLLFNGEAAQSVTTRGQIGTLMTNTGGVIFAAYNMPNPSVSQMTLGISGAWRYPGILFEMIVVDGTPTTDVKQRIEGYLAHKCNMTSLLPTGHPYKSSAPTV